MNRKVEIATEISLKFCEIPGIVSAYVDDYNKYGSFQVVLILDLRKSGKPNSPKFSLRKISNEVKSILKANKEVSSVGQAIYHPERKYDRSYGQCTFDGYDKGYSMVDFVVVEENEQVTVEQLLGIRKAQNGEQLELGIKYH
jgi:hypothetical protein